MTPELKAEHASIVYLAATQGMPVIVGEWRGGKVREQSIVSKKDGKSSVSKILEGVVECAPDDGGKPSSYQISLWQNRDGAPLPEVSKGTQVVCVIRKMSAERANEATAANIMPLPATVAEKVVTLKGGPAK